MKTTDELILELAEVKREIDEMKTSEELIIELAEVKREMDALNELRKDIRIKIKDEIMYSLMNYKG